MSANITQARWGIEMRATAPLHHGAFGGDAGNAILHRRVPLMQNPAHPGVPAVSGNALRGALRRIVMRELFDHVALSRLAANGDPITLTEWDRLYGALANGGHIDKGKGEVTTDPNRIRTLRESVPPLSVFGASLYKSLMAGRVSIGWLWVVCRETIEAGLCRGDVQATGEELLTEIALARHVDREEQDPVISGVTPMPMTVEALVPGTILQGEIICLRRMTDVERGCLAHGLTQLTAIGGKGSAGFGRVDVHCDLDPTPYREWLADQEKIRACRDALIALAKEIA